MMVPMWICSICLVALALVQKTSCLDPSETQDLSLPPASSLQHNFYGLRGRENIDDLITYIKTMREPSSKRAYNAFSGKRASAGFHGMRGKKWYNMDYDIKRASAGFHGMRGKKDFDETIDGELQPRDSYLELAEMPCKQYNELLESQSVKSPVPVLCPPDQQELEQVQGQESGELVNEAIKRGSSGFHGMRGKKETEWSLKRAMGFLGMRGKKMENPLNL